MAVKDLWHKVVSALRGHEVDASQRVVAGKERDRLMNESDRMRDDRSVRMTSEHRGRGVGSF